MDQIKAIFENINIDEVMTVVANYVSKIEIESFFNDLWKTFLAIVSNFIPLG